MPVDNRDRGAIFKAFQPIACKSKQTQVDVKSEQDRKGDLYGRKKEYGFEERFCREKGELRSGGRRREVVRTRGEIARIAVRELGYSGAETARYLGVTTSCVNRAAGTAK